MKLVGVGPAMAAKSDHMFAGKNIALVQEMDWVVLKLV
jgi:hypothetical protein